MNRRQKIRKGIIIVSFVLMPLTFYYFSPYLTVEASLKGIISGSFLFFILLFISSLVVGRAFCGWVCPGAGIQETIAQVQNKKIKKGNLIKWIIWIPWIAAIILIAIKNGGYSTVDPLFKTKFGLSVTNIYALMAYMIVLVVIVVPAFVVGQRSFCHSICWMAPFMIIGRKIRNLLKLPSLQLSSVQSNCNQCSRCDRVCPMSLPVKDMVMKSTMEDKECILCGTCVDSCKSKAISFDFSRPKQN